MPETSWDDVLIATVVPYKWGDEVAWDDDAIWNDGVQWQILDAASED